MRCERRGSRQGATIYRFIKFFDAVERKDVWINPSEIKQVEDSSDAFPQPTTCLHFSDGSRVFVQGSVEETQRMLDE